MSLEKFIGGFLIIIVAIVLFVFAIPFSLLQPNALIWIPALWIVSFILAITGLYYIIKGIVEMSKGTSQKHEIINHEEKIKPEIEQKPDKKSENIQKDKRKI